eukprot:Tbor_TRINITY_DN5175_c2_g3::TRINITY_DN5175_c2_g3_i1::g.26320::m.26320/K03238/EIF2S2; translation initiation factor 2 subunit 2
MPPKKSLVSKQAAPAATPVVPSVDETDNIKVLPEAHVDPEADSALPRSRAARHTADDDAEETAAAAGGSNSDTSDSDSADDNDDAALVPWVYPDYDSMTAEEFENLLRKETKVSVQARKRDYDENTGAEERTAERKVVEGFLDGAAGGYTYYDMMDRISKLLGDKHGHRTHKDIPAPMLDKIGTKKTVINNFGLICDALDRTPKEVQLFFEHEKATTSTLDQNNMLILKLQRVKQHDMEATLRKYIDQYVKCSSCGSINTQLVKDRRRYRLICRDDGSERYVQASTGATYLAKTSKRKRVL